MKGPSKNWLSVRGAALDRAMRTVSEPLQSLQTFYIGVCLFYIVGFFRFQFLEIGSDFTLWTAVLLLVVALCGALIPLLTASVLTLHFALLRLRRLASE
ncbi:hypothetical protein CSC82_02660 [Rhodobacteraceae bacterium 4F10]|nr:hypothetical protein CSC82_02660 [Rhodobacteraceae bacterium 4F10]